MKNFNQMSNKKLNAFLNDENITADEKKAIQEVLNSRNAANVSLEDVLQEQKELSAKKFNRNKMTDDERVAIAEKLRAEAVNHRCEVVPFDSLDWVTGVVVSVIEEPRNNKVVLAIKTDDGRRIIKAYNSQLVKILDEIVEPKKKIRSNRKTTLDENGNPIYSNDYEDWPVEDIENAIKDFICNVGKTISFPKSSIVNENGNNDYVIHGRIVSLVINKRQQSILYRIELDKTKDSINDDDSKGLKKYIHKTVWHNDISIADSLDEIGQKINESFTMRHHKNLLKVQMTPIDVYKTAEASLNKAKEALTKIQATLEKRQADFDKAKIALDTYLTSNNV